MRVLFVEGTAFEPWAFEESLLWMGGERFELQRCPSLERMEAILESEDFDVVTFDLGVADGQGLGSVERVLRAAETTPVLVLTRQEDEVFGIAALELGAFDYIVSGERPASVLRALRFAVLQQRWKQERSRLDALLIAADRQRGHEWVSREIAHEFSDLLTIVAGHAELLVFDRNQPEESEQHMREIMSGARRASAVCEHLVRGLDDPEEAPSRCDPHRLVQKVVEELGFLRTRRVEIVPHLEVEVPRAPLAEPELRQVLVNLVANACEALGKRGGIIQIHLDAQSGELPGFASAGRPSRIRLSVEDDGPGFSESALAHACEPAWTTKPRGAGLGLRAVQAIVGQTGGTLVLGNHGPEGGASVQITWDAAPRRAR